MAIKVGINGFGRIGRMAFRAIAKDFPGIEVVGINDLLDPDYLAYMLWYDSVHGNFPGDISVDGNTMIVNGKKIRLTAERDPANLKWNEVGADLVIECTGFFLTEETCQKHTSTRAPRKSCRARLRRMPPRCSSTASTTTPMPVRRSSRRPPVPPTAWLRYPRCWNDNRYQTWPDDHGARSHRDAEDC